MPKPLTLEKALKIIMETISTLPAEHVPLTETLGRILADNLIANQNLPPQHQSAVDGFALGYGTACFNSQLVIKGHLDLDEVSPEALGPGQAMGVSTGGVLPEGTWAVVPHEVTDQQGGMLTVLEDVKPGSNIKQAGEDIRAGELLLGRGTRIDPGAIAWLAAFGLNQIPVYRKPRVGIVSLGSNVVPYQQKPAMGQSRDSNIPLLKALVEQDGGIVVASMAAAGNCDSKLEISCLWEKVDLLITTGASYTNGKNDVTRQVDLVGIEPLYWGVPILPGSHSGAAHRGSRLFLSLSGNPAACAVCYYLFASPALQAMQGLEPSFACVQGRCINGFGKKSGSRRFVRAHAVYSANGWEAIALPGQKPSMIRSLITCNALIDVPAYSPPLEAGAEVSIILLDKTYTS